MIHERLSAFLARVDFSRKGEIWHFCPACNEIHRYAVGEPFNNGAKWKYDEKHESPTLTPSMNIVVGPDDDGRRFICHYWIKAGRIEYLQDCTHALRGLTVPLPPIPERYWSMWK